MEQLQRPIRAHCCYGGGGAKSDKIRTWPNSFKNPYSHSAMLHISPAKFINARLKKMLLLLLLGFCRFAEMQQKWLFSSSLSHFAFSAMVVLVRVWQWQKEREREGSLDSEFWWRQFHWSNTHTLSVSVSVLFYHDRPKILLSFIFVRYISTQRVSLYLLENSSSWFSFTISSSFVLIFTKSTLLLLPSKSSL